MHHSQNPNNMNNKLYYHLIIGLGFLFLSCGKGKEIVVTSVSIGQATAEMLVGETVQLNATVLPSDATDKTINWASSKQSVAPVSKLHRT